MIVHVHVTKAHLAEGERREPAACALALALRAMVAENVTVCVHPHYVQFKLRDEEFGCIRNLPLAARAFVKNFDASEDSAEKLKPQGFRFSLPDWLLPSPETIHERKTSRLSHVR